MNLYPPYDRGSGDGDQDLLTAMVEEAIAETLVARSPRPAPPPDEPDAVKPISAENFLADAAAFLRARPDAGDLLRRLQALVDATSTEADDVPGADPETAPEPDADDPLARAD